MLKPMKLNQFDCIYTMIVDSFPSHEVRNYEEQKGLLDNPKFHIYVMEDDAGGVKAFISVWDVADYGFVDHFAVSPKFRNEGLGSKILEELHQFLGRPLFLEVDLPETDIAKRRIGFYERNGYTLNPYPYQLPALTPESQPVTLRIMSTDGMLSQETFQLLQQDLLATVYGVAARLPIVPLDQMFSVCKVLDYSQVHWDDPFVFLGKTTDENSLVCSTQFVPSNVTDREDGWRGFYIQGVLDFSLLGILAKIATLLADHQISIFVVSTFNTDYVLVKDEKFQSALEVLRKSGLFVIV